jgi:YggT family protein
VGKFERRSKCEGAKSVQSGGSLLALWSLQLLNFVLAILMYTLLGRALLGLIIRPDSSNYIWRFFCRITDPFIALIAYVTPKAAAPVVLWLFGVVWLFWLRVGLLFMFFLASAAPKVG